MKTHAIGIIGLGVMGREMAEMLADHPRFTVVAGFDPARPDVPFPLLGNEAEVVNAKNVDAIYTATPPAFHEDIVRLAVAARKPFLCEKPLAHTIASARSSCEIVASAGIPAAVNFSYAARGVAVQLARVVKGGGIGTVQGAHLRVRFGRWPRSWQSGAGAWLAGPAEGGFTREVVSHFVFLANRLFGAGRLTQCAVERGSAGTETKLTATIAYPELNFTIDAGIGGDRDDDNRFQVTGSRGEISIVDWSLLEYAGDAGPSLPATSQLDALADMLDGKPHQLASFAEGLAVAELIEEMLAR
ncbi:Gfo/Idh/MocA family protein [Dongia sp.]|uniref:Gfo/Idh/MocA family protein n=1 Tax=Dongia sp. TaxID=1977262 RepID=UPI0035B100EC